MKLNQLLLLAGLAGPGVVGATQTMRSVTPEAATTYSANGQLQTRTEQRDGVPEGLSERWHADGSKQAEGQLRGGRMEGEWQFWLPDGTPDLERSGMNRDGNGRSERAKPSRKKLAAETGDVHEPARSSSGGSGRLRSATLAAAPAR